MSLRYVVPTLGALALTTAAPAIEVGDLTIGGFIDTILEIETSDGSGTTGGDDSIIDFSADAELRFGYNIGDAVSAQLDIEVNGEANDVIRVEQANVSWKVNETATLTMGKSETLIGYEAVDAPDQWRVGSSLATELQGTSTTGLNVGFAPSEQVSVDFYIVDGIYATDSENVFGAPLGKLSSDFSFGFSVNFAGEGFFVDFDVAIDTGGDFTAAEEDIQNVSINGEYTGTENLTVFGDIQTVSTDSVDLMAILIGANYKIDDSKSITGMISTLDEDADDSVSTELAVALLTNPTGDANFALNVELALFQGDDVVSIRTGAEDSTEIKLEWIAIIP